ncbi:Putative zinc- or iron-chelating domain protein [uncultured archaeon]|nr:Putative zinc- or iron-chelating domain protein [uncultured archaeon]
MRTQDSAFDCDIKLCNSMCCRNCAVLTRDEVSELISKVREEYALELDPCKYFRPAKGEHGIYYAMKMIKGRCIFLNKENRCRIYKCRPALCELYPVIDVDAVDENCPIVAKLPREKIESLKRQYAEKIDEMIQEEEKFLFI